MAIKIKNLQTAADNFVQNQYIYKDLTLDISQSRVKSPGYELPIPGTDIKASYDLAALANSLTNLFNTIPGQRFLFPEYGLNLNRYLFEPITEFNARDIGNKIYNTVSVYEPRVAVNNVEVTADPDNNQYLITIQITVPTLNTSTKLDYNFNLKNQSFLQIQSN